MTAAKAVKGRRASARRPAEAAPQTEDRLERLERMLEGLVSLIPAQQGPRSGVDHEGNVVTNAPDEDEPEDKIDRAAELAKRREKEQAEDKVAQAVISTLIDARHLEIFRWLARLQGKSAAQLLKEILRSAMIKERAAWREFHGGGGNSSRDAGALAERLPGRK